jgi:spermidine synthase
MRINSSRFLNPLFSYISEGISIRRSLLFAFFLMGFTSINIQILLVREFIVTFYGNEISIGIIIANWIILEAVGSSLLGRTGERVKRRIEAFASLQLIVSVFFPLALYGARIVKNIIGVSPGEGVSLPIIFFSSFLLLLPLGLGDGAQFSYGSKIYSDLHQKGAQSVGKVYIYEAIGSMTGGIIFTYIFLSYLNSMQITLLIGTLNLSSALLLLATSAREKIPRLRRRKFISFPRGGLIFTLIMSLLLMTNLYLLLSPRADELQRASLQRQWKEQTLKRYENSIYGNIAMTQRGEQLTLFVDGLAVCNIPVYDIVSIEELVHLSLLSHPSPIRVLLIGGGAGGVINEVLKHPIEEVYYAELDPLIIQIIEESGIPLIHKELSDPRVHIEYLDSRLLVKRSSKRYDVLIVNLPSPSTLLLNRSYTLEFFREVSRILNPKGILVLSLPGYLAYMSDELRDLNADIYITLKEAFPYVRPIPGDYNLFLASPDLNVENISPEMLHQRLKKRSLKTSILSEFYLEYKLNLRQLNIFLESLDRARGIRDNRDLRPSGLFYSLALWNALFSPRLSKAFNLVSRIKLWMFILPLGILSLIFLILRRRSSELPRRSIWIAIATTGFAGMVVDMVLIFAFQSLYGYVYYKIGLIFTAFMIGLALGGSLMNRALDRMKNHLRIFTKIELGLVLYSLSLPLILMLFYLYVGNPFIYSLVQAIFLILSFISGVLTGSEFPLANEIYLKGTKRVGRVAGTLYASDLFGSWFGTLAAAVILIPVLGIYEICFLTLLLKLVSFALVYIPSRFHSLST